MENNELQDLFDKIRYALTRNDVPFQTVGDDNENHKWLALRSGHLQDAFRAIINDAWIFAELIDRAEPCAMREIRSGYQIWSHQLEFDFSSDGKMVALKLNNLV